MNSIASLVRRHQGPIGAFALLSLFVVLIGCGGGGGGGGTSTTTGGTTSTTSSTTSTTTTATTSGTTTSETTGSTGSSLPANRIFFVENDPSNALVRSIATDGTDVQTYQALPSPSFKGFAQSPADATVLVFGYTSQGGSTPSYALYKNSSVDITGAVPLTPVEFKSFGSIKITPDGSKVVFTASLGAGDSGVYVVGIDGSGLTKLDDADDADISPTGTRIVYTRFRPTDSHSEICAKNLDSSGFAQLTNNASDDILPQYSKDGTKIVFASDRVGGHFEIFSMTSAGASQTKLTTDSDADFGATFSPDASQIAYTRISTDTSLTGVYKKAATTATATALLYASPGIDLPIYWTPATTLRSRGPHGMPFTIGTSDRLKKRLGLIR